MENPALKLDQLKKIDPQRLFKTERSSHPARILILYGSLRKNGYSFLSAQEAAQILDQLGCEVKFFNPSGLPLLDDSSADHPKVAELRELVIWCEGMVWSSPECHGAMSATMKAQIDWIPLSLGELRPTQGKTLALMQVCGGKQSFNSVNQMRIIGRWMRCLTIPNHSSIANVHNEFDAQNRMQPSAYYNRIVDVMEELTKFTYLTRDLMPYLVDRYSERIDKTKQ